jgi:hypothetical protein
MNISNPLIYAAPLFLGFILLEVIVNQFFGYKKLCITKDFKASLFIGIGTFHEYDNESGKDFGVLHPPESYYPLIILTHEFKDNWSDIKTSKNNYEVWMNIFGPPGWSNEGSGKTSRELQNKYILNIIYET